jgi:hypothetical protein
MSSARTAPGEARSTGRFGSKAAKPGGHKASDFDHQHNCREKDCRRLPFLQLAAAASNVPSISFRGGFSLGRQLPTARSEHA